MKTRMKKESKNKICIYSLYNIYLFVSIICFFGSITNVKLYTIDSVLPCSNVSKDRDVELKCFKRTDVQYFYHWQLEKKKNASPTIWNSWEELSIVHLIRSLQLSVHFQKCRFVANMRGWVFPFVSATAKHLILRISLRYLEISLL